MFRLMSRYIPEDKQYTPLDVLLHMHNGQERYGPLFNYQFCKVLGELVLLPHSYVFFVMVHSSVLEGQVHDAR